jgi:tetratricopeptide (TPR) repeat protein
MLSTIKKSIFTIIALCFVITANANTSIDTKALEKMFRDQEFETLITTIEEIGEENLSAEQYRIYVYALSTNDLDDAEDAAERAIGKYNNDPDMFVMHASIMGSQAQDSIFSALGYAEKALNSLNRAVEIEPNDTQYLSALMSFYIAAPSIAGGDMDKALELATEIAKLDALDGVLAIARYELASDKPQDALTTLEAGLESFPNAIQLYSMLARVNIDLDNFSQAIANYEQATQVELESLSDENAGNKDLLDEWERNQFRLLNSHYQIGRLALNNEIELEKGIRHLNTYISLYSDSEIDVSNLPSINWANLRLAGLYMASNSTDLANDTIKLVNLENDSNMKKIHKKLQKRIKRAL